MVEELLNVCFSENFEYLVEPGPQEVQIEAFKDHLHDQSCLSALVYEHHFETIPDETYFQFWPDYDVKNWRAGKYHPILAMRNKTGRSKLKMAMLTKLHAAIMSRLRILRKLPAH